MSISILNHVADHVTWYLRMLCWSGTFTWYVFYPAEVAEERTRLPEAYMRMRGCRNRFHDCSPIRAAGNDYNYNFPAVFKAILFEIVTFVTYIYNVVDFSCMF